MKIRLFTILLALSALFVAGMAAFFSVYGIAKLFAGSLIAVAVMAGSLEFAKLITASFLYRYWKRVRWHLKTYFIVGILVLMIITSAGIIGYLTSSYQGTTVDLERQQTKLDFMQSEVVRQTQERDRLQNDKQQLQDNLQQELSGLIFTDSTRFLDVKRRKEAVARYQPTIDEKEKQIQNINNKILESQSQVSDLKVEMIDTGVDVGPLVYLARVFNTSMDNVVKLFIFLIVFVFDPLAVALVIATNMSLDEDKKVWLERHPIYIPNEETIKAIEDTEKGIGLTEYNTVEEMMEALSEEKQTEEIPVSKRPNGRLIEEGGEEKEDIDIEEDFVVKMPGREVGTIVGQFIPTKKEEPPKKNRFSKDILYGNPKKKDEIENESDKETIKTTEKSVQVHLIETPTTNELLKENDEEEKHKFYYGVNKYKEFALNKLKWLKDNFEIEDVINDDIPLPDRNIKLKTTVKSNEIKSNVPMTEEEIRIEWDRIVQEVADKQGDKTYRTIN
jgi:hypothetical protein